METEKPLSDRVANIEQVQVVVNESFCVIHQDIVIDAEECKACETVFCKECIDAWIYQANSQKCPSCRTTDFQRQPVGRKFRNSLAAIKFFCSQRALGCEEIIPYENLSQHQAVCKFLLKECPGCKEKISALDLQAHCSDECISAIKLELAKNKELNRLYEQRQLDDAEKIRQLEDKIEVLEDQNESYFERRVEIASMMMELQHKILFLTQSLEQKTKIADDYFVENELLREQLRQASKKKPAILEEIKTSEKPKKLRIIEPVEYSLPAGVPVSGNLVYLGKNGSINILELENLEEKETLTPRTIENTGN